jgi:starch synthase
MTSFLRNAMRVLFASSEIYPLAKTGGLADVSAALPAALRELGIDLRLIMPGYAHALATAANKSIEAEFDIGSGVTRLVSARTPDSGLPVWLVDCPSFFTRDGTLYHDGHGTQWPDNAERFAYFSRVVACLASGELTRSWRPDVVHTNDWQVGLVPLFLDLPLPRRPAILFTIHNMAYQGFFPGSIFRELRLPESVFAPDGIEFYGGLSFLKAGIRYSDRVTTVSPSYAREILTAGYGCGLDSLLRRLAHQPSGILNGVDNRVWNPASDPHLAENFGGRDLSAKRICKTALQQELGLEVTSDVPLIVSLSRLTNQKMTDIVIEALPAIMSRGLQFALLGHGDRSYERRFENAARYHPGRLAVRIGYEEPLAHRFLGGADLLLHPSRFEPCGLVPLYALRYGVLPVVRHVGGLADTVVDADKLAIGLGTANGFTFRDATAGAMLDCLDHALELFRQKIIWRRMQRYAMSLDFGWNVSARRYLALYQEIAPKAAQINAAHADKFLKAVI